MTDGDDMLPGRARAAALIAVGAVLATWLVLAALQVADDGFYSDDWGIQWDWDRLGYSEAVQQQFDVLGSKPLLAIALPGAYGLLGSNPAWHHVLAAALSLSCAAAFYLVLRQLRFESRDALPIALLALMFPWASGIRFWPAGSLNDIAILFLFGGFLLALRGLRIEGRRGLLLHLVAAACYAASVLTYEATTAVALFLWPAYVWLRGWRPALPRAIIDVSVVGAAAVYALTNTQKNVESLSEQVAHLPDMLGDAIQLVGASLLPASTPTDLPLAVALVVVAVSGLVLALAAGRWIAVAGVSTVALALCWAVYVPQALYTPTFEGLEDRVNVLALYPAAVLVWSVLRAAGGLLPRNGYPAAAALAIAIVAGYAIHDFRQQDDWAEAARLQDEVLDGVERASPRDGELVLTFRHPAETAPRVPVFSQSWDLHPAAQLRTGRAIHTYPVFEGARIACISKGVAVEYLATPLYDRINLRDRDTPKLNDYSNVIFVDVESGRHEVIRSPGQCRAVLRNFMPGS